MYIPHLNLTNQPVKPQGEMSSSEQTFLVEVFNADPVLYRFYAANPRELSLFKARHYFQSIMTSVINLNRMEDVQILALSDDGACLNFGRNAFFTENNIQPVGQWSGRINGA